MFLVLVYGIIKGFREICKKKALEKNSVAEVLLVYTFLSLIICLPQIPNAMGLSIKQYFFVALKAFIIFVAWIAGFKAIKKLPISVYGILDLSRVLFATFLGVIFLGEIITIYKFIGLIFVSFGLLLLKRKNKKSFLKIEDSTKNKIYFNYYVFLAFLSCVLNAFSGLLDKVLMKEMNSSQLQFWYTLFLVFYYAIYAFCGRIKINKNIWKNVWVYLLAIGLIIMDKSLFIANGYKESQITVMTLIKQSSVIVAIIAGKFIFKEKNIIHKMICALIIVLGILIGIVK